MNFFTDACRAIWSLTGHVEADSPQPLSEELTMRFQEGIYNSPRSRVEPNGPNAFDNLPDEVIELIFISVLANDLKKMNHRNCVLTKLCLICRRWRSIAVASATLWSAISVQGRQMQSLAIIRKWLERSKDCPLEFEIFLDPEDHFMIRLLKEDLESVISVFLQQSRRWKGIVLDLPHLPPIDCVLFKDIQAPQLTSLTISNTPSYGDDSSWNPPHYLSPIIATAFSIERVTWKLLEIDSSTLVNNLIGTHITDLHLEGRLSIQHCISLLLRSPLLRNCHLDGVTIGPFSVDINSVTPFTLPHLHSLFIIGDQDLLSILAHITAPLLGSLSIGAHTYRDSPVPSELFKFLARSSPPLQHLTLDGRQIQRERIIQCLHLSPHLQTLEIFQKKVHPNYMALTDELMTALGTGCSENGVFICPELTKIRFMGNVVTSDGVFSQMVGERRGGRALANGVASLVYVQVEFGANSTGHSADVERLVNMRPEGLVARVYVGSGDTESD